MHLRGRALTGISTAAIVMACLTSTAHADGATDAAEAARKAAYQAALAAKKAAPVTPRDVAKYAEAARFKAVATSNGVPAAQIDSLLSSGDWIGYPVETTLVSAGQDVDPETATEESEAQAADKAPLATEVSDGETATPDDAAPVDDSLSPTALAALTNRCYSGNGPTITVKAKNAAGSTLWYYQVGEQYCFNGKSITSRDSEPYVNHKVYAWAQALGWSWEGQDLTGKKGPSYYRWKGNSKGGLKTWRKGEMKYDPTHIDIGSFQKFPWVHLYEHADGSYKYTYGM